MTDTAGRERRAAAQWAPDALGNSDLLDELEIAIRGEWWDRVFALRAEIELRLRQSSAVARLTPTDADSADDEPVVFGEPHSTRTIKAKVVHRGKGEPLLLPEDFMDAASAAAGVTISLEASYAMQRFFYGAALGNCDPAVAADLYQGISIAISAAAESAEASGEGSGA